MTIKDIEISTGRIVENTETYVFWFKPYGVHVNMTICEATGYIKIDSCYGQYQYGWPSYKTRGNISLKNFLFSRVAKKHGFDYVMDKFSYGRDKEFRNFNIAKTVKTFKEELLEFRKNGDIGQLPAMEMWEKLGELFSENPPVDIFINSMMNDSQLSEWFPEPYEYCAYGLSDHQTHMRDLILPKISEWMIDNVDLNLNCVEASK